MYNSMGLLASAFIIHIPSPAECMVCVLGQGTMHACIYSLIPRLGEEPGNEAVYIGPVYNGVHAPASLYLCIRIYTSYIINICLAKC